MYLLSQTRMEIIRLTTDLTGTTMSNTSNTTQEPCGQTGMAVNSFFIFFTSLVFLVSLALNTITMRVYFCTSHQFQSSVTIYLKNLAAADFFLCLVMPLRIANYASNSTVMRRIYCTFAAPGFYLNMYASILFMNYIAFNRYLKIVRPFETHTLQTIPAARYMSVMTWASLCGMTFIYVIVFLCTSWGTVPDMPVIGCKPFHSSQVTIVYQIFHCMSAFIFIFVLVSLILLYWGMVRRLRRAQTSLQALGSHQKLCKSKRNMLVLVMVFCVCFVPYHLVRLPYVFKKSQLQDCTAQQAFYIVKEVTVLLSALNVCMDPLIYFVFCKTFRAQMAFRKKQLSASLKLRRLAEEKRRPSRTFYHTETRVSAERCESVV